MKARITVLLIVLALVVAGCVTVLKDDERAWCDDHLREVVTASFTIGSHLSEAEARRQAEADDPSDAYKQACRTAYTNK